MTKGRLLMTVVCLIVLNNALWVIGCSPNDSLQGTAAVVSFFSTIGLMLSLGGIIVETWDAK